MFEKETFRYAELDWLKKIKLDVFYIPFLCYDVGHKVRDKVTVNL